MKEKKGLIFDHVLSMHYGFITSSASSVGALPTQITETTKSEGKLPQQSPHLPYIQPIKG